MNKPIHFFILFIVITLGAAAGNLLTEFGRHQYFIYQQEKRAEIERKKLEMNQKVINLFELSDRKAKTEKGQRLQITCKAWTDEFKKRKTPEANELMIEHCLEYHEFLNKE